MELRASCIIKVGGSLLGLPDLPSRLANCLHDFSRPRPILVAGGGPPVELVRNWDRIYGLGEEECHWIALRLLSTTTRIVARLLPEELVLAATPEECLRSWEHGRIPVYDAYHFIAEVDESTHDPLPRRWRVTSDSIAARMAVCFGAPELVLLKSIGLPERYSMVDAAREAIVDPHFPIVARDIPRVIALNLRQLEAEETVLYDPEGIDADEPPPPVQGTFDL